MQRLGKILGGLVLLSAAGAFLYLRDDPQAEDTKGMAPPNRPAVPVNLPTRYQPSTQWPPPWPIGDCSWPPTDSERWERLGTSKLPREEVVLSDYDWEFLELSDETIQKSLRLLSTLRADWACNLQAALGPDGPLHLIRIKGALEGGRDSPAFCHFQEGRIVAIAVRLEVGSMPRRETSVSCSLQHEWLHVLEWLNGMSVPEQEHYEHYKWTYRDLCFLRDLSCLLREYDVEEHAVSCVWWQTKKATLESWVDKRGLPLAVLTRFAEGVVAEPLEYPLPQHPSCGCE